jgi:hypothetical protein
VDAHVQEAAGDGAKNEDEETAQQGHVSVINFQHPICRMLL